MSEAGTLAQVAQTSNIAEAIKILENYTRK